MRRLPAVLSAQHVFEVEDFVVFGRDAIQIGVFGQLILVVRSVGSADAEVANGEHVGIGFFDFGDEFGEGFVALADADVVPETVVFDLLGAHDGVDPADADGHVG